MSNKLLVSNLAWNQQYDEKILRFLSRIGITEIELSPYRDGANLDSAYSYVEKLKQYDIKPYSIQAIQYRQPVHNIFNSDEHQKLFQQLDLVIDFAKDTGIKRIVFGCPKNRTIAEYKAESNDIALKFFLDFAKKLEDSEIVLCIEPIPEIYNSNFLINTNQTIDFVEQLNNQNIKVNFDLGSAISNDEDVENLFTSKAHLFGHIHISEPHLKAISTDKEFHTKIAKYIQQSSYQGGIAVEMLPHKDDIEDTIQIIEFFQKVYQN